MINRLPLPIGRCTGCGQGTHDIDALNCRCDDCGKDLVISVAVQDWRPCAPCLGSGKSLIRPADGSDTCPVCHGSGYITRYPSAVADSEMAVVEAAVENEERGRWPPDPKRVSVSETGSLGLLRRPLRTPIDELSKAVDAAADALSVRD